MTKRDTNFRMKGPIRIPHPANQLKVDAATAALIDTIEGYIAEMPNAKIRNKRWGRALAALGVDNGLPAMSALEAHKCAARGWKKWIPVAAALKDRESRTRKPAAGGKK